MIPDEENQIDPDQQPPSETDSEIASESGTGEHPRRKKVRIKVRKKIRIKKKPSAKKRIRKIAERAFWVVIIAGFIASLIIMVVELDIRDEKFKQQKKATPVRRR